eukprot:5583755-Amphidinium_carterae.2
MHGHAWSRSCHSLSILYTTASPHRLHGYTWSRINTHYDSRCWTLFNFGTMWYRSTWTVLHRVSRDTWHSQHMYLCMHHISCHVRIPATVAQAGRFSCALMSRDITAAAAAAR